jgi:hypothetical protein
MTLAERLLAGEHHGCATWAEAARRLACDPKTLYIARKALEARGVPTALIPNKGIAVPNPGTWSTDREDNPAESGKRTAREADIGKPDNRPARAWPNVEAFDEGPNFLDEIEATTPPVKTVPPGHTIKGVSTYVDADGSVKGQWIKTTAVNDERAAWMEAMRTMSAELPRMPASSAPEPADDDLLVVLPVGDPHVGLLSWREDAGENFDLKIAERGLVAAFENLIARAPSASEALLVFIGDNTHADGQQNTTTKGTRVDVDGRTVKMVRTIIDVIRQAVAMSLAKFGRVTIIVERGNHDELLSAMIALALGLHYEDEPRVTVDQSPEMYHWFRFGQVLIGTHHGDKAKPEQLLGVMAVDRAADWAACVHRRFYCGHYHHQIVKELPGLIVEYLPTLASSDAWHRAMGYRSARAMYMDVFHREWGHIDRCIVGIRQLRAA